MSKRPSLAEGLRQAATLPEPVAAPPVPVLVPAPPGGGRGFYAATRSGKKKVTASLAPADHKRLRRLALERDATTEALLAEAIHDLFTKYGQASGGQGRDAS